MVGVWPRRPVELPTGLGLMAALVVSLGAVALGAQVRARGG